MNWRITWLVLNLGFIACVVAFGPRWMVVLALANAFTVGVFACSLAVEWVEKKWPRRSA
jgi:peptidoglycan biosynthesis protein MviN/MurJ (putative lipid II flippase)